MTDNPSSLQGADPQEEIRALKEALAEKSEEIKRLRDSTPSRKEQPEGHRLNLNRFSELNRNRAAEGFKTYKNVPITYWTTAIAGEVGELCNMIKKQERVAHGGIDGGSSYTAASLTPEDLKEEIGGIFIYLDLLSGLLGIDLTDAIIHTFNSKSEKYGFAQKYTSETSSPASEAGMSQEDLSAIIKKAREEDRREYEKWIAKIIEDELSDGNNETLASRLAFEFDAHVSCVYEGAEQWQSKCSDLERELHQLKNVKNAIVQQGEGSN